MSRWFRHYAGMMRDDKLVRVAIRSKQTIERVLWVWGAILESAAEIDDDGRYDFDAAEAAYFLRADGADICSILDELTNAGRLAQGCVIKWGNRQFSSDRSKDRVAAHRERKRAENSPPDVTETKPDADVTLQKRHRNAPETETELDTESEKKKETPKGVSAQARIFLCPSGVDPDVWSDFLKNRRRKSLTNTVTAYQGVLDDIAQISADTGKPPGDVVRICTAKGWGSINDWRKGISNNGGNSPIQSTGVGRTASAALAAFPELAEQYGGRG